MQRVLQHVGLVLEALHDTFDDYVADRITGDFHSLTFTDAGQGIDWHIDACAQFLGVVEHDNAFLAVTDHVAWFGLESQHDAVDGSANGCPVEFSLGDL